MCTSTSSRTLQKWKDRKFQKDHLAPLCSEPHPSNLLIRLLLAGLGLCLWVGPPFFGWISNRSFSIPSSSFFSSFSSFFRGLYQTALQLTWGWSPFAFRLCLLQKLETPLGIALAIRPLHVGLTLPCKKKLAQHGAHPLLLSQKKA